MKTYRFCIAILLALDLGACANATPGPIGEDAVFDVYTAAAMTFAVQSGPETMQSTPAMVSLPPSPTSFASPTLSSSVTVYPPATSYLSPTAPSGCYNSAYVSDVTIDDGTELAPGESFEKTWMLKNTGACAWDKDILVTFYSGEDMDGETTVIGKYVTSGNSGDVSVRLTAPDTDGTYTGYWILADRAGTVFGATFYVQITVSSDVPTSTSTPTSTNEATNTSTATAVSTNTSTPVPTETPTPTPASTSTPGS